MLAGLWSAAAAGQSLVDLPDGEFWDNDNADDRLLVFVSGLGGLESWRGFVDLAREDPELAAYDLLVYGSPRSRPIDEHVGRLAVLVAERAAYPRKAIVGHSIGGMIARSFVLESMRDVAPQATLRPQVVVTFGTPYRLDKFQIAALKRLGSMIAWPFLSRLEKEVFKVERLAQINRQWRALPAGAVTDISVFGTEDRIAPTDNESRTAVSVFVAGDHLGIVSPDDARHCSFAVLKAVLRGEASSIGRLDCVVR